MRDGMLWVLVSTLDPAEGCNRRFGMIFSVGVPVVPGTEAEPVSGHALTPARGR